jgi:hypothetical protein
LKRVIVSALALLLMAATLVACGGGQNVNTNTASDAGSGRGGPQADHIQVQHILIGFKDAVGFGGNAPAKAVGRTQDQARTLAYDLLNQAKGGADFDKLVVENTDDSPPGIYGMSNTGIQPADGEYQREGMVPAFGNVGFTLQVGEIGIADYDPATSPYGYHVIKRVK